MMAYFSNGTEGMDYQDKWCCRCIHDINEDCPIMLLHLIHNGEKEHEATLNILIPEEEIDGVKYAAKCSMFVLRDEQTPVLPRPIVEKHVKEVDGVARLVF